MSSSILSKIAMPRRFIPRPTSNHTKKGKSQSKSNVALASVSSGPGESERYWRTKSAITDLSTKHSDLDASIVTQSSHVCHRSKRQLNNTMSSVLSSDYKNSTISEEGEEWEDSVVVAGSQNVGGQPISSNQTPRSSRKAIKKAKQPKFLTTKPVRELFDWVIQPLPELKGVCVEGKKKDEEDFWHSSAITEVKKGKFVKTASGTLYRLRGRINKCCTLENGFSKNVVNAFANGFPPNWKKILETFYSNLEESISVDDEYSIIRAQSLKKRGGMKKPVLSSVQRKVRAMEEAKAHLDTILTPVGLVKRCTPTETITVTRSGRMSLPPLARWQGQQYIYSTKTNTLSVGFQTASAEKALLDETISFMNVKKSYQKPLHHKSLSNRIMSPADSVPAVSLSFELPLLQKSRTTQGVGSSVKKSPQTCLPIIESDNELQKSRTTQGGGSSVKKSPQTCLPIIESDNELQISRTTRGGGSSVKKSPQTCLPIIESDNELQKSRTTQGGGSSVKKSPQTCLPIIESDSEKLGRTTRNQVNSSECSVNTAGIGTDLREKNEDIKSEDNSNSFLRCIDKRLTVSLEDFNKKEKNKSLHKETRIVKQDSNTLRKCSASRKNKTCSLPRQTFGGDVNNKSVDHCESFSDPLNESMVLRSRRKIPKCSIIDIIPTATKNSTSKSVLSAKDKSVSNSLTTRSISPVAATNGEQLNKTSNRMRACRKRKRESPVSEDTGYGTDQCSLKLQLEGEESTPKSCVKRQVKKRRKLSLPTNDSLDVLWTGGEKELFERALQAVDVDASDFWFRVAEVVESKTECECRKFHTTYLEEKTKTKAALTNKSQLKRKSSGRQKGDPVLGAKGTLKRKGCIREFLAEQNEDYEDNPFDGTPFRTRKLPMPTFSHINFDKDDSEIFGSNHNFITPMTKNTTVLTPGSRLRAQLASTKKTPTHQANNTLNDTPVAVLRQNADKYIHTFMQQRKKNPLKNDGNSSGVQMECSLERSTDKMPVKTLVSPTVVVYDKERRRDDDNDEAEAEEENNPYVYYWDDDED